MSLSQASDKPQLRTASARINMATGGGDEDTLQLEADRDSRIVAVAGGKNSNNGFIEISKSSSLTIGQGQGGDNDAQTVYVVSGNSDSLEFGSFDGQEQYIDWDEGEELHVHTVNNTGASINGHIVIYYLEEHEC